MCFSGLLCKLAGFRRPYWYISGRGADLYGYCVIIGNRVRGVLNIFALSCAFKASKIIILVLYNF